MSMEHGAIHEKWHQAIVSRDLDALMALYAEDATIDSAAVLVLERNPAGILRGKPKLREHFRAFFALVGAGDGDWYRLPVVGSDATTVSWEYPSAGPKGEQLDVVESFDVEEGLIAYHRVYWGRVGFKLLNQAAARQ